jgi:hypothetical protein
VAARLSGKTPCRFAILVFGQLSAGKDRHGFRRGANIRLSGGPAIPSGKLGYGRQTVYDGDDAIAIPKKLTYLASATGRAPYASPAAVSNFGD